MAAGLGFKTVATGDVLSAADTNGYLMQGVLVFASAAARDSAITSPQEGQFAYLKDTNVTTYYTGSAWANLDTTGMTNPMTTTGDTIYSSSGSTPARLGIGSTGNILTVAGGVPTWAAPAAGGWTPDLTLINAGGTALSGSATVTVSGISGKNSLYIFATGVSSDTAGAIFTLRLNADSGSNYRLAGLQVGGSTYETAASAFKVATQGTAAGNEAMFHAQIIGTNSTGQKVITAGSRANGTSANAFSYVGSYFGSSAISSVSILTDSGSFDAGTIYVYGG